MTKWAQTMPDMLFGPQVSFFFSFFILFDTDKNFIDIECKLHNTRHQEIGSSTSPSSRGLRHDASQAQVSFFFILFYSFTNNIYIYSYMTMMTMPGLTQMGSSKSKGGVKRKGSGAVFLLSLCRQMGRNGWGLVTCRVSSPLVC